MKNDYEVRGDVTAIVIHNKKHGRIETLVSTNMLPRLIEYPNSWYARKDTLTGTFYVLGNLSSVDGKQPIILLHRWLMNALKGMQIDHINHDTLNNTSENLREVTVSENGQNRKGARKNNKSGYRGVIWHKKSKAWNVQLRVNRIKMSFGYFANKEEANRVAIEARRIHMPFAN